MIVNSELENRILGRSNKKTNFALSSCIEFFSGVFVTAIFGYFLDYALNTGVVFSIIFLLLGCVIGFMNIYRFVRVNKNL
jgi:F0F1-type ATP synthase assembly protein I